MSHVATVDIIVTDLEALKKAAEQCGLEFKENQKTHKWYGSWVNDYHAKDAAYHHGINPKSYGHCEHAIGVKGNKNAYEIGIVKNPNGAGHVLIWDFWQGGNGLLAKAGDNCDKLFQAYTKEVTVKQLKKSGYVLSKETVNSEGELELTLTSY